ncbi:MAG: TonB-dependent receptor [Vicinamibacterales bacterium]
MIGAAMVLVVTAAFTFRLPAIRETVTVVASRTPQLTRDAPAPVRVFDARELQQTTVPALDGALARAPSFSLFRRSSSLASHPTTHGVSLRGIGASGASRTLVLVDGVPENDGFGNWVHWSTLPLVQIERVELTGSGLSTLYGSSAMAGAIAVVTRHPPGDALDLRGAAGSLGAVEAEGYAGREIGGWRLSGGGRVFRTGGYIQVAPEVRGPVDEEVRARHATVNWRAERVLSRAVVSHTGRLFFDTRDNGTPLQDNDTRDALFTGGLRMEVKGGALQADGFARAQRFRSTFTAIAAGRASETLTLAQRVPSLEGGGGAQWFRDWTRHSVTMGGDLRGVGATDDEEVFVSGVQTRDRVIEANQLVGGAFAQDRWRLGERVDLTLSVRADRWRNYDASRVETVLASGERIETTLATRSESSVTPRAALVARAGHDLVLRASAYGGFRAPSLNELYRPFRVGNVLTEANEALSAERLSGVEGGANGGVGRVTWQATAFWSRLDDPISNVTVTSTPALITRQRRNLGRARVAGAELDAEWRSDALRLRMAWFFADATVQQFPADPSLVGRRLPQVPPYRGSAQASWRAPFRLDVDLLVRVEGERFDDDQNRLRLAPFGVVDARVARAVGRVELFLAGENVFDRRYAVQATPVEILGTPRTVMLGTTVRWPS